MILSEQDGLLYASNAYDQRDFLTSSDERFRPVNVNVGPEGALYVTDMYRGIIQHAYFMTPYLAEYIRVRLLEQPIDQGRIWRVVPNGAQVRHVVLPQKPAECVEYLSHPNGWVRDNAQRLLVCAGDLSVKPALQKLLLQKNSPIARLHAFWTLEGLGEFNPQKNPHASQSLRPLLADADPRLRAAAVKISDVSRIRELLPMAGDPDAKVRGEVAFRLASLPGDDIQGTLMQLSIKQPHPFVSDALICGYAGREGDLAAALLSHPEVHGNEAKIQPLLKNLARCVMAQRRPRQVGILLSLAAKEPLESKVCQSILAGIAPDLNRLRRETNPRFILLQEEPTLIAKLEAHGDQKAKEISEGLKLILAWPGKPGFTPPPPAKPLTPADQELFAKGKELYTSTCAGCHQASGFGAEGIAPPLVDSEWVLGTPERSVRILLHGLSGPIRVNNRNFALEMPPLGALLDDPSVAAILTYIRREWGHTAPPVSPAQITSIRANIGTRTAPWTEPELLAPVSVKK